MNAPKDDNTFELEPSAPPPPRKPAAYGVSPASPITPDEEATEPAWPRVLAYICLIFGGFGVLVHALNIVNCIMWMTGTWANFGREMPEPNYWILIPRTLYYIAMMVLAFLLFYGGFLLFLWKQSSVPILRLWSMIKIALVVIGTIGALALLVMPTYHMLAGHDPETDWAHWKTAGKVIWTFIRLLWGLTLPVFILLWFRRKTIKAQMAAW